MQVMPNLEQNEFFCLMSKIAEAYEHINLSGLVIEAISKRQDPIGRLSTMFNPKTASILTMIAVPIR
ncbi:hypothetical protein DSM107133_01834 [Pseudosulfitobacter sp. DSM 107133]|nr:hypothetical protein DSM107133_01834 [Pseudosulfitobacter sp. DSM 107133]